MSWPAVSHSCMLFAVGLDVVLQDGAVLSLSSLMMLLPPSGIMDMRHMLVVKSCHPLMMVSLLKVISHPCEWKNASQLASHDADTDRRLFVTEGASCASLAAFGSLFKSSSNVLVVNMRSPAGWMIVFAVGWVMAFVAGALELTREMFTAESANAVLFMLGGLVQPDL